MNKILNLLNQFNVLLPLVSKWAEEQEAIILENGVPLTTNQKIDAHFIGVKNINKVRLMKVKQIPLPSHPLLNSGVKLTQLISPQTIGITFRYGIYIREDQWDSRRLIVHELTHTMQYERYGAIRPFLKDYLEECLTKGYPNGELELEAIRMEREICRK